MTLNDSIDWASAKTRLAAAGRAQITNFLSAPSAAALRDHLAARADWRHVVSGADRVFEIARSDLDRMPREQTAALEQALHAEAAHGFRFRYDLIRTPEPLPPRRPTSKRPQRRPCLASHA